MGIFIDVLVDDVVGESNFLERLGTGDNDFPCRKDTAGNLLHVFRRFELNFDCRVSIRLEGNFEDVVVLLEPIGNLHEVDIVVEAMFSGQELEEVPKVFKKFSIEEFSTYMGLIFAYGFGCSGMFN